MNAAAQGLLLFCLATDVVILATIVPILFIIIIATNIADINRYNASLAKEKTQYSENPNMFYKDGLNVRMFSFIDNSVNTEAYTIYFRQQIVSILFYTVLIIICIPLIAAFPIIAGAYMCGSKNQSGGAMGDDPYGRFSMMQDSFVSGIVDFVNNIMETITAFIPLLAISVLLLVSMPFVYNLFYNKLFLGNVHNTINKNMIDINILSSAIYDNIVRHDEFLENMVKNNMDECIKIINRQGSNYDRIGSMIFTLSLYNNYKASSDEEDFVNVREIFTVNELSARRLSPAEYLTNKQPRYIHNLMSSIEGQLSDVLTTQKQIKIVKDNVAQRINNINELISSTLVRRPAAESVIDYLWKEMGINMIPLVLFGGSLVFLFYKRNELAKEK